MAEEIDFKRQPHPFSFFFISASKELASLSPSGQLKDPTSNSRRYARYRIAGCSGVVVSHHNTSRCDLRSENARRVQRQSGVVSPIGHHEGDTIPNPHGGTLVILWRNIAKGHKADGIGRWRPRKLPVKNDVPSRGVFAGIRVRLDHTVHGAGRGGERTHDALPIDNIKIPLFDDPEGGH